MINVTSIKLKLVKDQMKQKPMRMMKAMRTHMMLMMKIIFSTLAKNAQLICP
jgi:hypothetical protein